MTSTHEMAFFHSNFMLHASHEDDLNQPSTSLAPILPSCTAQEFHGKRSPMAFPTRFDMCEDMNNNHGDDELSDDASQLGEKKRRLNMEQVKTLENNFELENKLEPERKMQLARALGLQPRQVAIWFQNRRARWKTKQLEKDYEILKGQFDAVKAENDALHTQNQKFHAEILALKNREPTKSINLNKETEGSSSNRSENSSEIKLEISRIDSSRPMFPSLLTKPSGIAQQLFHNSSRPEIQLHKMDQTVKEESLCNMFNGIDDQTTFWPWLEEPHFN